MAAILIVEDRIHDRKQLSAVLRSGGHTVIETANGAEALERLHRTNPALIISDILMPLVDGYELVRRVREEPELSTLPVIFYTAMYHEREAQALARAFGVSGVITKPSTPDRILTEVTHALGSSGEPLPALPDADRAERNHAEDVKLAGAEKLNVFGTGEHRLAAVVEFARVINAEHDSAVLLTKVCAAAREVAFAQHAIIGLLDEQQTTTVAIFSTGLDQAAAESLRPPPLEGSPLAAVVRERRPSRVDDPAAGSDWARQLFGEAAAGSLMAAPLATATRVYGWLLLRNKLGADSFTDSDLAVVAALATQAAIAYENARLIEDSRRQAVALLDAQDRTRFAMAAAHMGVWDIDLVTNAVTWSETLAPVFGLEPAQAPATLDDFLELVHPDDRAPFTEHMRLAIAERKEFTIEFRALWPDGTHHWVGGRARVAYDDHGRPARLLGVGMDVHREKLLERQFYQAQKVEAIGQLAGGIAHDFNNMLTAVLGNANLILDELDASSPLRADVEEIVKAAERAAALTRQLLAFGRKQMLQPVPVDLNTIVKDLSQMLRRVIGEHIELATVGPPNLSPVRADPTQIEQVIMNLVVNARDAMPTGGRLSIETTGVELDETYAAGHIAVRPGRYVMLAVSDTGTGMDDATKRRLFEPFFTTKERGKGTGLGLATVYGIVKQSGGSIWVYSELGHGTTFKVYLPVADEAPQAAAPAEPAPRPLRGSETILLVEDEPAVRQLTRVLLERAGYRVIAAGNAQEAVEQFLSADAKIDLVITDVVMPGASGPALLKYLTERRPNLKVLFMSGYADDAVPALGRLDKDAVFLQKPFTGERLIKKVHEALRR
jgi:PAS domain S-box-containing protein